MAHTFKPRQPYLFGGHNQRTARRADAVYIKHLGIKTEKPLPQRIEKKAINHYDAYGSARMHKLPRRARKLMLTWLRDEMRSVQSVLVGYVDHPIGALGC